MTYDAIWQQLLRKKPALANDNATVCFTSASLQKLLRQVYEQGRKTGSSPLSFLRDIGL